ncbi:MAG: hypothetical protein V5A64_04925 [Candidatus Thermoplasmatota archaeon]
MKQITKAQITTGALAFFAIVWGLFESIRQSSDILISLGIIALALIVMLILSFIIMSILEWIRVFDLKTNALITLVTLCTFGVSLLLIF